MVSALGENVSIRSGAQVFSVTPDRRVEYCRPGQGVDVISARTLLIATGAYEAVVPFQGWTLPGVMTLGGAQNLFKTQGLFPGKPVVLAGSGPFLWLVSQQLIRAGADVAAVVEAKSLETSIGFAMRSWRRPALAVEGATYWARILGSRAPFRHGWGVLRAEGDTRLETVTIAPYGRDGRLDGGRAQTIRADALCISHTLVPATQITDFLQCDGQRDPISGATLPFTDELMETSHPAIFAAGELRGIGGMPGALLDGRCAGLGMAARLDLIDRSTALEIADPLRAKSSAHRVFTGRAFTTYAPPKIDITMPDDTLICRCETVRLGAVKEAIMAGAASTDLIKSRTRSGMGSCQGRMCGRAVQDILMQARQMPSLPKGFKSRVPLKPVPIDALINNCEGSGSND